MVFVNIVFTFFETKLPEPHQPLPAQMDVGMIEGIPVVHAVDWLLVDSQTSYQKIIPITRFLFIFYKCLKSCRLKNHRFLDYSQLPILRFTRNILQSRDTKQINIIKKRAVEGMDNKKKFNIFSAHDKKTKKSVKAMA